MSQNDKQLPSLTTQAKNYLMSYARWVLAGKPLRPPERIAALFAYCEQCPSISFIPIDENIGRCIECGCWLQREGTNWNKLAWPTEPCPNGHFDNEVEEAPEEKET